MAEPTLGARIMEAAFRWQFERALNGMGAARAEYDTLVALCALADAAERGMVATVEWRRICDRYAPPRDEVLAASDELDAAVRAWRAITEEVQP